MVHHYRVFWFTFKLASFGLQTCIAVWNEHPIPGKRFHIYSFRLPYFKRMSNFKPEYYSFRIILLVTTKFFSSFSVPIVNFEINNTALSKLY